MKIQDVPLEKVMSVYSGKPDRCCCGCSGIHRFASDHRKAASQHRGYTVKLDEINDHHVKKVLNILKENASQVKVVQTDKIYSLEYNGRLYIVYLLS